MQDGLIGQHICPKCLGTGLGEQATHTTFHGKTITELENMYIRDRKREKGVGSHLRKEWGWGGKEQGETDRHRSCRRVLYTVQKAMDLCRYRRR